MRTLFINNKRHMTTLTNRWEKTILVIEDDESVSQLIRLYLAHEGYRAVSAKNGIKGLNLARSEDPDLVLLDLNLPGLDGAEICRSLRVDSDVPIIMVTARVDEDERLEGLDLGADDYVTKPFSPRELMARIRAVMRRSVREQDVKDRLQGEMTVGEYAVDLESRTVRVSGKELTLTPTEYRLLIYFMNAHRRTVSREQIIENAIGYEFDGFDRTVDTHISNLRRKLEKATGGERHLKTVYGIGYRFETA